MSKHVSMINGCVVFNFDWKTHGTRGPFAQLWGATSRLEDALSAAYAKKAEIDQSRNFTPVGRTNAMRDYLRDSSVPALRKVLETIEEAEAHVVRIRGTIKPRGLDKTDVAGAMRRQEIRSWLRSIEESKRNAMMNPLGVEEIDPEIAAAVTEAPAPLSGVTNQQRARLSDRALVAQYPKEVEEIAVINEAIRSAASYVRMAREVLHKQGAAAEDLTLESTHGQRIAALLAELPSGEG